MTVAVEQLGQEHSVNGDGHLLSSFPGEPLVDGGLEVDDAAAEEFREFEVGDHEPTVPAAKKRKAGHARCMSLAPLEEICTAKAGVNDQTGRISDENFAKLCNVSTRAIGRWRNAGDELPWYTADVAATALGKHPRDIWGEEWTDMDQDVIDGTSKHMRAIERDMEKIGRALAKRAERERRRADAQVAIEFLMEGGEVHPRNAPFFLECVGQWMELMVDQWSEPPPRR